MNIILLVGIISNPISIIFDAYLGTLSDSLIPLVCIFLLFAISFYLSNVKNKPNIAVIILTAVCTDIIVPFLYFKDGGRYSSMPLWMALASIFVWFLVKGWACYVIFASNIIVYTAVFLYEQRFPNSVIRLADEQAEFSLS